MSRFRRRWQSTRPVLVVLIVLAATRTGYYFASRDASVPEALVEGPYHVDRVIDGFTMVISRPRPGVPTTERARVRLLGVAPLPALEPRSSAMHRGIVAPADQRAALFTRQLAEGRTVHIRLDRRRVDPGGDFLAYVYVGERLLNEELVREGLACVRPLPADAATVVRRLEQAEQPAAQPDRGGGAR